MSTPDFLSIKEFAAQVGVHPHTIRRSIKRGRISAVKIGGGVHRDVIRIPRSEINRLALIDYEKVIEKEVDKRIQQLRNSL